MPEASVFKRRSRRVATALEGTLRGRKPRAVTVVDLSQTGCLARCPAALDAGSIHDLGLRLGDASFDAKARVTGSSVDGQAVAVPGPAYLVAFEFLRLAARDEAVLRGFLDGEIRRACGPSR